MSAGMPVLRRIRFTPWQDLLRLRLSGRLDWRSRLEHSELSETIRSMIRDVIVKSRLTPSERASVAGELISHFQDGQDAGQTGLQLVASFGDVDALSRLIQRGKERNRSMFGKMIKVLGGASAITVAAGIVWLILFSNRQANPTTDYVPRMNTRALAAGPMQKAWPIYRESWTRHRFVVWYPSRQLPGQPMLDEIRPGDPAWEPFLAMLDERQDLIAALRKGAALPALGIELKGWFHEYSDEDQQALFPDWYEITPPKQRRAEAEKFDEEFVSAGGAVVGVLLPHIQALRTAGRILVVDSRRALQQGNTKRAVENVELTLGLAHQASEPACLVAALVGFAIADQAFLQLDELLIEHREQLADEDLSRLKQAVRQQDFRDYVQLDGERAMLTDLLQACYTDNGNGDGKITRQGLSVMTGVLPAMVGEETPKSGLNVIWAFLFSSRADIQAAFDEWFDRAEPILGKAWHESSFSGDDIIADIAAEGTAERYLLDILIPAIDGIRNGLQLRLARQEASIAAIALIEARRAEGSWPRSLDELVPRFLDRVPVDRASGKPILYRLDPDPILYTPGPDGDDDGGKPLVDNEGRLQVYPPAPQAEGWQGDWILWPAPNVGRSNVERSNVERSNVE